MIRYHMYNMMQWYDMIRYDAIWCNDRIQYDTIQYVRYDAMIRYDTIRCNDMIQCDTICTLRYVRYDAMIRYDAIFMIRCDDTIWYDTICTMRYVRYKTLHCIILYRVLYSAKHKYCRSFLQTLILYFKNICFQKKKTCQIGVLPHLNMVGL